MQACRSGWRFRPFLVKSHDPATIVMGCMMFHGERHKSSFQKYHWKYLTTVQYAVDYL
jgi:choline-glycine betaine transporter